MRHDEVKKSALEKAGVRAEYVALGPEFELLRKKITLTYRPAMPDDIAACIDLRGKTRDNSISIARLRELGVTLESWSGEVADGSMLGHLCLDGAMLAGYCFGYRKTGEVVVLVVSPESEGKGIGKNLLDMVVKDFVQLGFKRVFLGASSNPKYRSHGFYRHLGWKPTGSLDKLRDEVLEYFPGVK
jgi:ribosomal protein S18 acetylase RimI-like enzyme